MAMFRFRLAPLLRIRQQARDDRRVELAEAYHVDDVLKEQLETSNAELRSLRDECRQAAAPGSVDVDRLIEAQRYELNLKGQITQIEHNRTLVAAEIERRRQALVEANREVRVLEKLRDKQHAHYQHEEDRRQVKRLDEIAQQQALREVRT